MVVVELQVAAMVGSASSSLLATRALLRLRHLKLLRRHLHSHLKRCPDSLALKNGSLNKPMSQGPQEAACSSKVSAGATTELVELGLHPLNHAPHDLEVARSLKNGQVRLVLATFNPTSALQP